MKKESDIYQKLARHLDNLPGGFPATESGVELRILRRLFTPEEAALALHLTLLPEEPEAIARRAGLPAAEAAERLEKMARRGLIFSRHSESQPPQYQAAQFVIGIWEYHVNDLSPELVRDMGEYIPHLLDFETWRKAPQLRTIPVGQSIPVEHRIMTYQVAEEMVRSQQKFLVAPCICRREKRIAGEGCQKPEEICLIFGGATDYYQRNGLGRPISQEEALEFLKKADEAGLVLLPSNSRKIANICCCCGCCCGVLRTVKRHPQPARIVSSAFYAIHSPETCTLCGRCVERCQMEASRIEDGKHVLDLDRCIGCGLCVTTCPTRSLRLVLKKESEQPEVPETLAKAYIRLARVRGRRQVFNLSKMWLHSKRGKLLRAQQKSN
jgi:Pyruvate/2-oxoacid:ferredoxin oxidoreductase delta subunit